MQPLQIVHVLDGFFIRFLRDAGIASQSFCLAAYEQGLGSVILGIFDDAKVASILEIPENQEVAALIAVGYPDEAPTAPKRKPVEDLLSFFH